VFNLHDLTGGNYRVYRTLSYPQFPKSKIVFDTEVKAISRSEWATDLRVNGTYEGPTDVVSVKDYQVTWTTNGKTLFEKGTATLVLSSGGTVLSEWSSSIIPKGQGFRGFPSAGEIVRVSYSPFRIDGNKMSYEWEGTVRAKGE